MLNLEYYGKVDLCGAIDRAKEEIDSHAGQPVVSYLKQDDILAGMWVIRFASGFAEVPTVDQVLHQLQLEFIPSVPVKSQDLMKDFLDRYYGGLDNFYRRVCNTIKEEYNV